MTPRRLALAATLWAALTRFISLLAFPPQAWVDEIWFTLRARELLQTGHFQIFYKTFWGGVHPALVWLTAVAQSLGLREVIVASRAVSAVAGVVTVPLTFVCLAELLRTGAGAGEARSRRWAAALASVVVAGLFTALSTSRLGTEPMLAAAAALVVVWQMRRAARTAQIHNWIAAGLALGFSQYISPHARFILPLAGLLGLHALWLAADRRRVFAGLALAALLATVVAAPLIFFFIREPEWFLARAGAVTADLRRDPLRFLLHNAALVLASFSLRGDLSLRENLPGRPLFDWIQSVGLYIGCAWAVWNFRGSAAARELLIWTAIMLAPALITDEAPSFERMVGVIAPAAGLAAIGWLQLYGWARSRVRRVESPLPRAAYTLIIASAALNALDYFGRYPASPGLAQAFATTPVTLGQELVTRAHSERVFVERFDGGSDPFAFEFLFPGSAVERLDFKQCLPLAARAARTTYLVSAQHDREAAAELARVYPNAVARQIFPEAPSLMAPATLIVIPPGAEPRPARSTTARFAPGMALMGYDLSGARVNPGTAVTLTLYWKAEADVSVNYTASVHLGTGLADSKNILVHDGPPCGGFFPTSRWRVGDVIGDVISLEVRPDAPSGNYPLAVGWYVPGARQRVPLVEADQPLPDNRAVIGTLSVAAP